MRKICLFTTPFPFMHGINHGIAACSKQIGPWRIEMQFFARQDTVVEFVRNRGYDGVIITYRTQFAADIAAIGIPVATVFDAANGGPCLDNDDFEVGRLGAQHLFECGYRRFAYCGSNEPWSVRRAQGFAREIVRLELPTPERVPFPPHSGYSGSDAESRAYASTILSLPRPIAIMACNDHTARLLLDDAIELGVRVPGEIAVLGVDNDTLLCETGACPLSSVETNQYRLGYEAALLIDRLMRGQPMPETLASVPPIGVVHRQSTNLFAHDDPDVASALRFIYERASTGISVDDVCDHVCLSRRRLEQRFAKAIGRSPGEEIRQLRIERAKSLLRETDMSLIEIANRCGYAFTSGFSAAFRDVAGISPGEYRKANRRTPT